MSQRARVRPTKLPSLGFVSVVLVHIGLVAFLAWGFVQPPLDRVWELSHALKIGKLSRLTPRDHGLLHAALLRHPGLTESLLSEGKIGIVSAHSRGWIETKTATVLVSADAGAPCSMRVEARLPESAFPLAIEVLGSGWQKQLALPKPGSMELPLPRTSSGPDIVEVRFSAKDASLNGRIFGIHLGFHCAEGAKHP